MSIQTLETLTVRLMTDTSRFISSLAIAEQTFAQTMFRMRHLAIGIGALTAVAFGKIATDFDEAMTDTMAVMRERSPQIRRAMEDALLNLSARSITAPLKLAKGFEELAKWGYDAARAMEALVPIERFAVLANTDLANSASELIRIQNGMGTASENALENARNLAHIGDVVASVGYRAHGGLQAFAGGVAHLAPFLRFNNISLEKGVALMAMYSAQNYTPAQASQAAMHFIQVLQRLPIKSEYGPFERTIRTGRFGGGAVPQGGVLPMHGVSGAGKEQYDLWKRLGIDVTNAQGNLDLDKALASIERVLPRDSYGRQHLTMDLGFDRLIGRILVPHMGASKLFQELQTQIRRSSGLMEEIYSDRLLSFNAQMKLLHNNVNILSIEIGRTLIPYMVALNASIKAGFDWWRGLNENVRMTVMLTTLAAAAFLALRAALPAIIAIITGLITRLMPLVALLSPLAILIFEQQEWWQSLGSTMQTTITVILSLVSAYTALRFLLPSIILLYNALYAVTIGLAISIGRYLANGVILAHNAVRSFIAIAAAMIRVIFVVIASVIALVFQIGLLIVRVAVGLAAGFAAAVMAFWSFVYVLSARIIPLLATTILQMAAAGFQAARLTAAFGQMALSAALSTVKSAVSGIAAIGSSIFSVIGSVISFIGTLLLLAPILAMIAVGLAAIAVLLPEFKNPFEGWEISWEAIGNAIMKVIGFLYNFKENMAIIFKFISDNWRNIFVDAASYVAVAVKNLFAILLSELQFGLRMLANTIASEMPWITPAMERRLTGNMDTAQAMQRQIRASGYNSPSMTFRTEAYPRPLANYSALGNLTTFMPQNVVAFIQSLPGKLAETLTGGLGSISTPKSIDFKEISLKRFMLEESETSTTAQANVSDTGTHERLDGIWGGINALLGVFGSASPMGQ